MRTAPGKNYSLGDRYNSNSKPILLSTISSTLEYSLCSALSPGMKNNNSTMLLGDFCAGERLINEDTVVNNDKKIGEMNQTIIVIFSIYST